jgi:hypothetical protein
VSEARVVQETEQGPLGQGHDGFHPVDAQRAEVGEQLRHQGVAHAAVSVGRIDADGVQHGHRLGTAEVAQVGTRHQEADDGAVQARGQ